MTEKNKMQKVLGLDIGANSLGWVLVEVPMNKENKGGKIIRSGTRIFQAGVDYFDSPKEKSKSEGRRKSRGSRRRIRRLAQRKRKLQEILKSYDMLPSDLELETSDPYELRSKGLIEKLTLDELGRVIYHLAQRRGFNTARKTKVKLAKKKSQTTSDVAPQAKTTSDNQKDKKKEEKKESILASISELEEKIEQSGKGTLGAYLYSLRNENPDCRLRKRHTRRSMYKEEFERLWTKQSEFYPVLTQELRDKIERIIFHQRDIYWKRSSIGECELEPGEKRCLRADRLAQEFRLLQEVNNLKYIDPRTNEIVWVADHKYYQKLIKEMKSNKEVTFDKIRNILELDNQYIRFNLETGRCSSRSRRNGKKTSASPSESDSDEKNLGRTKLKGMETDYILRKKKYFDKEWDKKTEDVKNEIVRILIERIDQEGKYIDEDRLRKIIIDQWGVTDECADNLLDVADELPQGRLSLSRKAIAKILPFMKEGRLFMADSEKDALHQAGYLRPDERPWTRIDFLPPLELVHRDPDKIKDPKIRKSIDAIRNLPVMTNPVVRQCVNETRRLVNAIIREYGRPDLFCIELAREAKANSEQRKMMSRKNNTNKKENEEANDFIREFGKRPSYDNRLRYRLWKEQREICPYTSKTISPEQLFSPAIDVDHIIPRAQGGEDARINKVVCFREANDEKGNRTPWQWLADADPDRYEQVLVMAQRFPYDKRCRFTRKEGRLDDFVDRQLNDTKYASRYVKQYLQLLFDQDNKTHVFCIRGNQTATLRHLWGLNNILHHDIVPPDLRYNEKNRADHRHHAVDALVIAMTTPKILFNLAEYDKNLGSCHFNHMPLPNGWSSLEQFYNDASDSIHRIVVSHAPIRRIRGSLCQDTYYGPNNNRAELSKGNLVRRKALSDLSTSEVLKIRDNTIREKLLEYLKKEYGINVNKTGSKLDCTDKQLKTALSQPFYLHNEEKRTPVRKVRIFISVGTSVQLRTGKIDSPYVIPGNTHHIRIFEWVEKKKGENVLIREVFFTTQLEVNRRNVEKYRFIREEERKLSSKLSDSERKECMKRIRSLADQRYPIIVRQLSPEESGGHDAKFVMSLSLNETLEITDIDVDKLTDENPATTLVLYKTSAATSKQLFFSDIRSAFKKVKKKEVEDNVPDTPEEDLQEEDQEKNRSDNKAVERFSVGPKRLYRKVQIDILGNIYPAGD